MGSIASFIEKKLMKKCVGSAVRGVLRVAGTALATKGYLDSDGLETLTSPAAVEFFTGAALALLGQAMSLIEKWQRNE